MVHEVGSLSLWFAALESNDGYPSVEELIAKARAPVKREYLRQSGTRVLANTVVMTEETMAKLLEEGDGAEMMPSGNSIPKTSVEKKSKRQQRRDRKEVTSS
jgi:Trk K+ transport system NAD-binding subunit